MKYLRIDLSKIMKGLKDGFAFSSYDVDYDIYEGLDIASQIKILESEKAKLDAKIQYTNWSNDL